MTVKCDYCKRTAYWLCDYCGARICPPDATLDETWSWHCPECLPPVVRGASPGQCSKERRVIPDAKAKRN